MQATLLKVAAALSCSMTSTSETIVESGRCSWHLSTSSNSASKSKTSLVGIRPVNWWFYILHVQRPPILTTHHIRMFTSFSYFHNRFFLLFFLFFSFLRVIQWLLPQTQKLRQSYRLKGSYSRRTLPNAKSFFFEMNACLLRVSS